MTTPLPKQAVQPTPSLSPTPLAHLTAPCPAISKIPLVQAVA